MAATGAKALIVGAVDTFGSGIASVANYGFNTPNPTAEGYLTSFGAGAVIGAASFGLGRAVSSTGLGEKLGGKLRLGRKATKSTNGLGSKVSQNAERATGTKWRESFGEPKPGAPKTTKEQSYAHLPDTAKTQSQSKLIPGTPQHKQARWGAYQSRGGQKSYQQWSRQYDTNMRNATYGLAREQQYREALGGESRVMKVPGTDGRLTRRQVDIYRPEERYCGQLKTGYVSLTEENEVAIQKDAWLMSQGLTVEWILEKGGSAPLLDALKHAGIRVQLQALIP